MCSQARDWLCRAFFTKALLRSLRHTGLSPRGYGGRMSVKSRSMACSLSTCSSSWGFQREVVINVFTKDRVLTSINAMAGFYFTIRSNLRFSHTALLLSYLSLSRCLELRSHEEEFLQQRLTYPIGDIYVAVSYNNVLSALEGFWLAHVGDVSTFCHLFYGRSEPVKRGVNVSAQDSDNAIQRIQCVVANVRMYLWFDFFLAVDGLGEYTSGTRDQCGGGSSNYKRGGDSRNERGGGLHHQQDDSDQTTHRTFTSVASPSIPQPTHGDRAPQAQVLLLHYLGRPSSIVLEGLGWASFSDCGVGCLHQAGGVEWSLFNPLFLPSLSSLPASSPHPPSCLLSNSLLHVANASSPQLPPADAYTLPTLHVHHLLLRSGLGTRLYGHVAYKWKGVCTSSIRAVQLLSLQARSSKNKVEDGMVVAVTPSLLTCHPHGIYQNHETRFHRAMFCASSANQCSADELVPQLDERVGVGTGELQATLKAFAFRKREVVPRDEG
ncbi:uncharacterized protein LACBIDRAFT_323109 [Laccaria bicolor S238N-H82]|uniref:Predicted protein n=1 Tax=Laccaria bicolor (strain S238N-H82 / ATCC MYA-4686) TaxID=486041 RepID=B0CZ56_LACBS|nr:uncharacterized protein LACBIDRAFT_323109 [Laccaria bicolor S238N-H82]EDR12090.1 predicted protein [Laccaria bicolor S238N-H82]|eukprot:XP_001876354.1 predicted protein [Laccaria bicolor S238N-H82]